MITELTEKELYNLEQLFSGTLHQDWKSEYAAADDALIFFRDESDQEENKSVISGLISLINSNLSDKELEELLFYKLGCGYYCLADWPSARAWLKHVVDLFSNESDSC